jgi:hypothetical protein
MGRFYLVCVKKKKAKPMPEAQHFQLFSVSMGIPRAMDKSEFQPGAGLPFASGHTQEAGS